MIFDHFSRAISFKNFINKIKFHVKKNSLIWLIPFISQFWMVDRMISSIVFNRILISHRDDNWFDNTIWKISIYIFWEKEWKIHSFILFVYNEIVLFFYNFRDKYEKYHYIHYINSISVSKLSQKLTESIEGNEARIF